MYWTAFFYYLVIILLPLIFLLTWGNKPPFFHYLSHIPPQAFFLQLTLLILYPTILTYKTTDMSREQHHKLN